MSVIPWQPTRRGPACVCPRVGNLHLCCWCASPRAAKFGERQGYAPPGTISRIRPYCDEPLDQRSTVLPPPPTASRRDACADGSPSSFCVCGSILSGARRAAASHVMPSSSHFPPSLRGRAETSICPSCWSPGHYPDCGFMLHSEHVRLVRKYFPRDRLACRATSRRQPYTRPLSPGA